jgi:hypothetical protein
MRWRLANTRSQDDLKAAIRAACDVLAVVLNKAKNRKPLTMKVSVGPTFTGDYETNHIAYR